MTKLDDALDRISQDIAQTSALTSEASRRYEEMFTVFRSELEHALDASPSMEDAARTTFAMVEGAAVTNASMANKLRSISRNMSLSDLVS